ncbi:MAG: toprim domain-containing protein [Alicyclobacillus sp.]|nr:toprim domain-containing protein [Alicyclobacillus sp.]
MPSGRPRQQKVIIVEGSSDRQRLLQVLREPVRIVCTRGTLSYATLEDVIVPLQGEEVYILVDADDPGMALRRQLRQELPNARHLYTRRVYREVARTPLEVLAKVLHDAHFEVDPRWLQPPGRESTASLWEE